MYVVGVTGLDAGSSAPLAGLYLFGQENKGWGRSGNGAPNKYETFGQNEGRWFAALPFGIAPTGEYPSVASYAGRTYICGGYTYNLVLDEHHRLWRQGLRPPEEAPDITGAAGTTVLAYMTWFDELTGERSPLSKALEIGTGTPRTWQNLPTRPPDDLFVSNDLVTADNPGGAGTYPMLLRHPYGGRVTGARPGDRFAIGGSDPFGMIICGNVSAVNIPPAPAPRESCFLVEPWSTPSVVSNTVALLPVSRATHLELWLAVAGDLPRLAMRVPIGTTTVVESKGIGDLGEAFVTQFQRFPRCSMNAVYHDRQIMAGDSENPDTVYLSALFQPERFEGLSFRTRDGKAITGLLATRDFCMVFTRSGAFLLQGYTDTDYTLNPVDQSIGAVGHHCNVVIHGNPYVWSEKGPYMFNGSWHPLSPENRWRPPEGGASMQATEDPFFNTYIVSQAYRAARSLNEPFAAWNQSGAGVDETIDPLLLEPNQIPAMEKYFGVLDYTLVQPETGGAVAPARLSWDRGDAVVIPNENPPDTRTLDGEIFMKYLRNRFGRGNLYRIISTRKTTDYTDTDWTLDLASFNVSGMELPGALITRNLGPIESSDIVTPFDYLGDAGGFLMEQKQIKRNWYYMRMDDGFVRLYMGPGPGYWGNRVYPIDAAPVFVQTDFVGGEYRAAPEVVHADVIMPVPPDYLSGRGMWLWIRGTNLFFAGFGVETIWGAEQPREPTVPGP